MKRIIIVDDAIEICRLFQDALRTAYPTVSVIIVPSGEEALLEATRLSFDLLVTDIRLPGMSGIELVSKVRVRQPHIKVVVITGMTLDEPAQRQVGELHPDEFLRKPVSMADFLKAVERLISPEANPVSPVQPPAAPGIRHRAAAQPEVVTGELADRYKTAPLNLDLEQPSELPDEKQGVSTVLSWLRGSLGALSAALLDERGYPVAQAGDLPNPSLEPQLLPPLMAAVSAGTKVSYVLSQTSLESVQAFRGNVLDLIVAPVGQYVLLVALRRDRSALRLALAFEEVLTAQAELQTALKDMGLHIQSAVEVSAPETLLTGLTIPEEPTLPVAQPEGADPRKDPDASLEEFKALFDEEISPSPGLQLQDADSFWESASSENLGELSSPGVLSFDQALKLGLLPSDPENG